MRLPSELVEAGVEVAIQAALGKDVVQLCREPPLCIPVLKLTDALRSNLFYAKSLGDLIIGHEAIEKSMANELRGLQKTAAQSDRVSRLLLVANDGSPRFYRDVAFLQKQQGARVLICGLDVDSLSMGNILGFKGHVVKTVLLNRKRSVVNVLKSLL
jgi:hypothetical protein